jgi:hypothetical protein
MRGTSSLSPSARLLAGLFIVATGSAAHAQDLYDPQTGQLSIPSLVIGNARYSNVVLTPASVLYVNRGNPGGSVDTYDPSTHTLSIPSVSFNGNTYTNVGITVGKVSSIGSATGIDTYDLATGELRIPYVQLGAKTYYNVVLHTGPSNLVHVAGGMPSATQDVYSGSLLIPALQAGNNIYTNVTLSVGLGNVASIGAASAFEDAPVQGLCYSTSPSATATAAATDSSGRFLYATGDDVTFWIDGSGAGCTGTASASATSVLLGTLKPTGPVTSVLALQAGPQVADTLTALNVGTAALLNVAGLRLSSGDIPALNSYIRSEGYYIVATSGSIDGFFNTIQGDTVTAGDAAPDFVTPVVASTAQTTSVLEQTATSNLLAAAAALPGQPTSITIPAGGELLFNIIYSRYSCPACQTPGVIYEYSFAEFTYLDGHGNVVQLANPGQLLAAGISVADVTTTGTYAVSGNVLTLTETGTDFFNGDPIAYREVRNLDYADSLTTIGSVAYTTTDTSTTSPGVDATGSGETSGLRLTPLTPAMVAGLTISADSTGCPGGVNTLSFTGNSTSVSMTQSCGGLPITFVQSPVPGILVGTDTSGYTMLAGLAGPAVAVGSSFVLIQVDQGSGGASGNGDNKQWQFSPPFTGVTGP